LEVASSQVQEARGKLLEVVGKDKESLASSKLSRHELLSLCSSQQTALHRARGVFALGCCMKSCLRSIQSCDMRKSWVSTAILNGEMKKTNIVGGLRCGTRLFEVTRPSGTGAQNRCGLHRKLPFEMTSSLSRVKSSYAVGANCVEKSTLTQCPNSRPFSRSSPPR
jgi:hypothetical protein